MIHHVESDAIVGEWNHPEPSRAQRHLIALETALFAEICVPASVQFDSVAATVLSPAGLHWRPVALPSEQNAFAPNVCHSCTSVLVTEILAAASVSDTYQQRSIAQSKSNARRPIIYFLLVPPGEPDLLRTSCTKDSHIVLSHAEELIA
mmetsp:Transcript_26149/g.60780  ORF Transcript_26149/g.60780 Transcript_26149/m.60780 type:complete len:149 (-) Transcript_26149:218-664(-)